MKTTRVLAIAALAGLSCQAVAYAAYPSGYAARPESARAADIYNAKDYGASGTNTSVTLLTQFGASATASLAAFAGQSFGGFTPYSWMTNQAFGLTFSMPTTAAQSTAGTGLTFLESLSGMGVWTATVATWQDPAHGNYLVAPGMLVSGSCIPAGTTVSSVDRTPGDANYGVITLSQATTSACASSTAVTFTIAPSQIQALTTDWLGIQGAMAAAWSNTVSGGTVYMPAGTYNVNHSLLNAGGVTDGNVAVPTLEVRGDGEMVTRLNFPTDFGQDTCGISEGTRGPTTTSSSSYHDFRLLGPNPGSRVNGVMPIKMDGLCIGAAAKVWTISIGSFHAGLNGIKDHWTVRDFSLSNNGYGIYFAPYTSTMGNQSFTDGSVGANTIGGFVVSSTDQIDSSTFHNIHTGFGPYGFYAEPSPSTVTSPLGFLTNSVLTNVWMEAVGNIWIYGTGATDGVTNDVFIGAQYSDVGSQGAYALPNGSGGVIQAKAVINVSNFVDNTMINTNWSAFNYLSDAIIEANNCYQNTWINDVAFIFNGTASVPALKCPAVDSQNRFVTSEGDGLFRFLSANVTAGAAVADNGGFHVVPYADGKAFAGITAVAGNTNGQIPILTFSDNINNVVKANSAQAINQGQPVFATTGGVAGGLDTREAIGVAWNNSAAGATTVHIDLDPGMKGGAPGASLNLTAAGTTQGTAFAVTSSVNDFTTVASGSGAILGLVPVGDSIVVMNDGANALLVYPQTGAAIGSAGTNNAVSVAAGTTATFRRISTLLWHQ